jgi:hypothetical protein
MKECTLLFGILQYNKGSVVNFLFEKVFCCDINVKIILSCFFVNVFVFENKEEKVFTNKA